MDQLKIFSTLSFSLFICWDSLLLVCLASLLLPTVTPDLPLSLQSRASPITQETSSSLLCRTSSASFGDNSTTLCCFHRIQAKVVYFYLAFQGQISTEFSLCLVEGPLHRYDNKAKDVSTLMELIISKWENYKS